MLLKIGIWERFIPFSVICPHLPPLTWLLLPEAQQSLGSKFPDCDKLRESVLAGDLVTEVRPGQVGDVRGPCLGGPRPPVPGVVVPRQGDMLGVVELPPQPGFVSPQGKQEDLE